MGHAASGAFAIDARNIAPPTDQDSAGKCYTAAGGKICPRKRVPAAAEPKPQDPGTSASSWNDTMLVPPLGARLD